MFFRIGTGEITDSLALEPYTGMVGELIPYFAEQPNVLLELKTKSDCVDSLLAIDPKGRVVVAWSMNPQTVIDLDEADFCKRVKNIGLKIMMCPMARCYHKSQTYSPFPDFRRSLNAFMLSRNIVLYQGKHLDALSYFVFCFIFLPIRTCFYTASLIWRKKFSMIPPYIRGTIDGLLGKRENPYQQRAV